MADVPAADDDDNGYQPARQRPSRGLSRKNHQSTNNIKAEDVISVASKLVVMSTEAAKALNPQLGDTDAMDTEARDDAHKFFSVHKRPIGATVSSSRSYTHTTGFHLSYVRYDQAKPAALFATEASVTNAFVRGGIDEKLTNGRRPSSVSALVWDKDVLLLEVAIAAHRAAQNYCVDKEPPLELLVNGPTLSTFDGDRIKEANSWMGAVMGGTLPNWLKFDEATVRVAASARPAATA
jgi:hypothetical protein